MEDSIYRKSIVCSFSTEELRQVVDHAVGQVIHPFIIYYVMKYMKILFKYNAYISQPWKYKNLCFHSSENTRFDIFTREKPMIGTTFFYFLNMV